MLPRAWKTSSVVPIPKTDKFDAKNYRPISLHPVTSIILEGHIHGKIIKSLFEALMGLPVVLQLNLPSF